MRTLGATTKEAVTSDAAVLMRVFLASIVIVVALPVLGTSIIGKRVRMSVPAQYGSLGVSVVGIVVPLALVVAYAAVQQVSSLLVAVPLLMHGKDVLEDVKAKDAKEQTKLNAGIASIVSGRQTILRVEIFMMVGIVYAAARAYTGGKAMKSEVMALGASLRTGMIPPAPR